MGSRRQRFDRQIPTASSLTDIFYVARRITDISQAQQAVRICLQAFEICPVDRRGLELALTLPGSDFEDNLQIASALLSGLDAIVTRDPSGLFPPRLKFLLLKGR